MLTKEECIQEARSNIAKGKDINLRNALRSLADYARVALALFGINETEIAIFSHQEIKARYDRLSVRIPELVNFKDFFDEIISLRVRVDHDDAVIPESGQLSKLITRAEAFQKAFEGVIIPGPAEDVLYWCELEWVGSTNDLLDQKAIDEVLSRGNQWLEKAMKMAVGPIEEFMMEGQGPAISLKVKEGVVKIVKPFKASKTPVSAYSRVVSSNPAAIDKILSGKLQWHWSVKWTLPSDDHLAMIARRAGVLAGRELKDHGYDNNRLNWVRYRLLEGSGIYMRVDLSSPKPDTLIMELSCQGFLRNGFVGAEKLFSPRLILAAVYGEITIPEFRNIVHNARGYVS